MSTKRLVLAAAMAFAAAPAVADPVPEATQRTRNTAASTFDILINPYGSVKVETSVCGGKLCGWVVWANAEAMQDARDSGVPNLIGTELLRDYRQTDANRWQGRVFVPDMGRTFYSTITRLDANAFRISGCVLGGLVCKSQIWHRA